MALTLAEKRARTRAWERRQPRERLRAYSRKWWRKIREQALAAYGGECRCCGEKTYEFLAFDHVNGDGKPHRAGGSNHSIASLLKQAGYPQDGQYQVLCHNCNLAKGFYGRCPHQAVDTEGW
jgi:hypothetical protein